MYSATKSPIDAGLGTCTAHLRGSQPSTSPETDPWWGRQHVYRRDACGEVDALRGRVRGLGWVGKSIDEAS